MKGEGGVSKISKLFADVINGSPLGSILGAVCLTLLVFVPPRLGSRVGLHMAFAHFFLTWKTMPWNFVDVDDVRTWMGEKGQKGTRARSDLGR